ncbi:MAG: beta-ketoacyl-[acyl-carrier-protein] synthase family protein [Candidatus Omnitrophica bacterium]|nr:beta-ketoacyl-[acyl-carrier-protein] synthase family protein [Candidatus Omnitrophota bacterium]
MNRRVVVTGVGAVSPLGLNVRETWRRLVHGESGIGRITIFDASEFPTKIAAEVRGFDFDRLRQQDPTLAHAARSTFFALKAAQEAFEDSRLRPFNIHPERFGIYFGAGDSGNDFESFVETVAASLGNNGAVVDKSLFLEASGRHMHALRELESQPFMTVTHLARRFDIRGPVCTCLTACAASSQAIGEAFEWIRAGYADIVMSGGSHSMIYPLGIAGFSLLTALSTRNDEPSKSSRPFDKNRDGFVLGEGAGVVILEELSHALKRNANIYGEIVGYGSTADAFRLTDMDPQGEGAQRAMKIAMAKGDLSISEVDYINAHGTGTQVNDSIETLVIKKVMKDRAYSVPVSSIKSMLGHMIAAAGALELIACFLSMRDSVIPPTINYEEPDPDCDLDYVPNESRRAEVHVALSNSFGFGGQNICLAVKKFPPSS